MCACVCVCVCVERAGSGAGFRHYTASTPCVVCTVSFVRPQPHPTPQRDTPGGEKGGGRREEDGGGGGRRRKEGSGGYGETQFSGLGS